jgi:hypothetical protein
MKKRVVHSLFERFRSVFQRHHFALHYVLVMVLSMPKDLCSHKDFLDPPHRPLRFEIYQALPLCLLCQNSITYTNTMMMIMRITILFVSVSSLLIVSVELFAPVPRRITHPITVPRSSNIQHKSQPSPRPHFAHAPSQELEHHHSSWFHGLIPRRPPRSRLVALQPQPLVTLSQPQQGATIENPYVLSPFETKCLMRLEMLYSKALSMKCPFLRRRATDSLDALEKATRLLLIRDRSLELIGPPIGLRCKGKTCIKNPGLSIQQKYDIILQDWKGLLHYRPLEHVPL